mmetsp:Transcript_30191/g.64231  ORF Transcript_30191/g.64231 Transcript_30191/m.64231 type:complete len:211 (-) Transcript_30191:924-1556(-)
MHMGLHDLVKAYQFLGRRCSVRDDIGENSLATHHCRLESLGSSLASLQQVRLPPHHGERAGRYHRSGMAGATVLMHRIVSTLQHHLCGTQCHSFVLSVLQCLAHQRIVWELLIARETGSNAAVILLVTCLRRVGPASVGTTGTNATEVIEGAHELKGALEASLLQCLIGAVLGHGRGREGFLVSEGDRLSRLRGGRRCPTWTAPAPGAGA